MAAVRLKNLGKQHTAAALVSYSQLSGCHDIVYSHDWALHPPYEYGDLASIC